MEQLRTRELQTTVGWSSDMTDNVIRTVLLCISRCDLLLFGTVIKLFQPRTVRRILELAGNLIYRGESILGQASNFYGYATVSGDGILNFVINFS